MDVSTIERKRRSETMGKYIQQLPNFNHKPRSDLRKLATKIDRCAGWLLYHEYDPDDVRLVAAETCQKHLLCPFCASGRGARSIAKNVPKLTGYLAERPTLIPVLLTLTVKNGPNLGERYRHLKGAFKRIVHRRRDALRRGDRSEFSKIDGAVYSFEHTFSQETGWHPHVHMVAFLTSYIDQKALSAEWLSLTGDSHIVDIRQIRPTAKHGDALGIDGALAEVYKYAVKLSDLTQELTWHAYEVLQRKRLTGSLGGLRGLVSEADDVLDDELDGKPYLWRFYRWSRRQSTYNIADAGYSDGCRPAVDEAPPDDGRAADLVNLATGEITPRPAVAPVRKSEAPEPICTLERPITGGTPPEQRTLSRCLDSGSLPLPF